MVEIGSRLGELVATRWWWWFAHSVLPGDKYHENAIRIPRDFHCILANPFVRLASSAANPSSSAASSSSSFSSPSSSDAEEESSELSPDVDSDSDFLDFFGFFPAFAAPWPWPSS